MFLHRKAGYHVRVGRMLAPLLLALGLLFCVVSACEDDSVFRSGDVPPSSNPADGSAAGGGGADGAAGNMGGAGGSGAGGAPTDTDGGTD